MARNYKACLERAVSTLMGITPDRVPLIFLTSEDIAARVTGLTIREMMTSPEVLAEKSILVEEDENSRFFGAAYQTYMKQTRMFIPFLF